MRWRSLATTKDRAASIATAMRRRGFQRAACPARTRESRCSGIGRSACRLDAVANPSLGGGADHPPVSSARLADYRLLREYPFCALITPMGAITGPDLSCQIKSETPAWFSPYDKR